MSFKIGIAGLVNSGKSFSRTFIPDGENVFLITPSLKATYIKTTDGKPLQNFNVKTKSYTSIEDAVLKLNAPSRQDLIRTWNRDLPAGSFKKENLLGNIQQIDNLNNLPIYLEFVSKHLPWIHTIILPDFTHHISNVISDPVFIGRKAGGDAFQKFWELAGESLRNFIISNDKYRQDLLIVTEYHAEFNEAMQGYDIYVPAGKMLNEKFKIPSYYDFLFFTDVKTTNEGEEGEKAEYRFVTKPTKKYPQARAMNLFEPTYIPNNLAVVLATVRQHLGLELK